MTMTDDDPALRTLTRTTLAMARFLARLERIASKAPAGVRADITDAVTQLNQDIAGAS